MKSDLYIEKSSFGYHQKIKNKKNTGSVTKASSNFTFLNLFDEYSYVFCPGTQQEPFGGVKEKKKKGLKDRNAPVTHCYPQLPDILIWKITLAILILDSETTFASAQLFMDSRAQFKKKLSILEPIPLPFTSSHASAVIFTW